MNEQRRDTLSGCKKKKKKQAAQAEYSARLAALEARLAEQVAERQGASLRLTVAEPTPTREGRACARARSPRPRRCSPALGRARARGRRRRADIGAAYGTAKSGVGIASMGVMNPGLVMRNIIPVVMAGVLGIYGLIVAVILQGAITQPSNGVAKFSSFSG